MTDKEKYIVDNELEPYAIEGIPAGDSFINRTRPMQVGPLTGVGFLVALKDDMSFGYVPLLIGGKTSETDVYKEAEKRLAERYNLL